MMRTYRGVVCEKKTKYMVFLTEKGEFLRGIPIGNSPEIGEEAEFTLAVPSLIAKGKAKPRFIGVALAAAVLLFFFMSSWGPLNEKVMAYVQLDAGAAMEFGVDRKGNVISLRYLNETPTERDRLSEWENHQILDVLNMAVLKLSKPDEKISITTIYQSRGSERETRKMIEDVVQQVRMKHVELNLDIAESTAAERKMANKKKMSIHQFKSTKKEKKHANKKDPSKEKPEQKQKDALQNPKKEIDSPVQPQQKKVEEEKEQQIPLKEKSEVKPNNSRSDKVPPHADIKGPPPHSSSHKHNKGNQGTTDKQQKENEANEKKQNQQNNK